MKLRPLNIAQNIVAVCLIVCIAIALTQARYDRATFYMLVLIAMLLADIGSRLPKGPSA